MAAKFGTSTKNTAYVLFDAIPRASWFWCTCRRCSIATTEHRSSQSLVLADSHKDPPTHTLNRDVVAVRWDADVTWCQANSYMLKIGLFKIFSTATIRESSFFTFCRWSSFLNSPEEKLNSNVFVWGKLGSPADQLFVVQQKSCSISHQMSTCLLDRWIRVNHLDNCDITMCVSMDPWFLTPWKKGWNDESTHLCNEWFARHHSIKTLFLARQNISTNDIYQRSKGCFLKVDYKAPKFSVWIERIWTMEVNFLQCDMPLSKAEVFCLRQFFNCSDKNLDQECNMQQKGSSCYQKYSLKVSSTILPRYREEPSNLRFLWFL